MSNDTDQTRVEEENTAVSESIEWTGTGTEEDPYVVDTLENLNGIREHKDAWFVLTADIDASDTREWNDGGGFTPVGPEADPFTGTIDGDGHEIIDLHIDVDDEHTGLIAYSDGGLVENLELSGVDVAGGDITGGVVGTNLGRIEGVTVRGSVESTVQAGMIAGANAEDGQITASTCEGTIDGQEGVGGAVGYNTEGAVVGDVETDVTIETRGKHVGGVVGLSGEATVRDATASGKVRGERQAGGVVGTCTDTNVENCSSDATVIAGEVIAGGIVGYHKGDEQVTDADFTGYVTSDDLAGGIVGEAIGDVTGCTVDARVLCDEHTGGCVGKLLGAEVRDCSVRGSVEGRESIGGIAGGTSSYEDESSILRDCTAHASVDGHSDVGGLVGFHRTRLESCEATGDVTGGSNVGGAIGNGGLSCETVDVAVTGGDVGGLQDSVGGVSGRLPGGVIEDATVTVTVTGQNHVGGVVGVVNDATIKRAEVTGEVFAREHHAGGVVGKQVEGLVKFCRVDASVQAEGQAGGISGRVETGIMETDTTPGKILECSVEGGTVTAEAYAGGVVGGGTAVVIEDVLNAATVTGQSRIGGLAGTIEQGSIKRGLSIGPLRNEDRRLSVRFVQMLPSTPPARDSISCDQNKEFDDCYWDVDRTGISESAGGQAVTTDEITGEAAAETLTEFNFDLKWDVTAGGDPTLQQIP